MDYRDRIIEIAARYAAAGEDLAAALLTGAPTVVTREEAGSIADWLTDEADLAWGHDPRHQQMAAAIRGLIE